MNFLTSPAAESLSQLAAQKKVTLRLVDLFKQQPARFTNYSIQVENLLFDYSKQLVTDAVLAQLLKLAEEADLATWINKLFSTEKINTSENRAAMHWALRLPASSSDSAPAMQVHAQLDKMSELVNLLHSGNFRGVTGEAITAVVNLGVGGSELGPLMANFALADYQVGVKHPIEVYFASSMDGSQLASLLDKLRAETTAFIISSKSFTTIDTMSNAATAYAWLASKLGAHKQIKACHFLAVSAQVDKMTAWGIEAKHQLQIWDWVGGRFSLWSTIGLPIALLIGMRGFRQLLAGAHAMDRHFKTTPWERNLPVLMALLGVWNANFLNINTLAILPYDGRLKFLADYLQQLEMESNGKSVDRQEQALAYTSCPIIWGNVGTNAQHAFYQLLHQGTQAVASDFIVAINRYVNSAEKKAESSNKLYSQHQLALANCLAQSRLLAFGDQAAGIAATAPLHLHYAGNQPSSTILLNELSPYNLGLLLAAYEHKVFVQAVVWRLNPFDQWGVEKGKQIAGELLPLVINNRQATEFDSSTNGLLNALKSKLE